MISFNVLKGKILTKIEIKDVDEKIVFTTSEGVEYVMCHKDDCCESVTIVDISGDLDDLLNLPILLAEGVSNRGSDPKNKYYESFTWTFYKLSTNLNSVTIRWYGSSNGYYSEGVDFIAVCYGCGEETYSDDRFCYECGDKIAKYIPVEQKLKYWKEKYEK